MACLIRVGNRMWWLRRGPFQCPPFREPAKWAQLLPRACIRSPPPPPKALGPQTERANLFLLFFFGTCITSQRCFSAPSYVTLTPGLCTLLVVGGLHWIAPIRCEGPTLANEESVRADSARTAAHWPEWIIRSMFYSVQSMSREGIHQKTRETPAHNRIPVTPWGPKRRKC
jgi:hypothetical protein